MAESSIQNVTEPRLQRALLYSAQLVILFFHFTHITALLTITKDQIEELEKGSTGLGNNAPETCRID